MMSVRSLLLKLEEMERDEAGHVAGTPDHGSPEGQENNWEVEAGGGEEEGEMGGR